jgi:hypothetical protein
LAIQDFKKTFSFRDNDSNPDLDMIKEDLKKDTVIFMENKAIFFKGSD